ncbi:hydroxyisourate hydrolase [Salinisphaera sp. T31B1]|uniref:hydroxyisourate hydrolase n=1 Tax=Salinisphaera sp. T31B1 TaxID=727963 RepID=UPI00333F815B
MGYLTTHVLDTANGCPGVGIPVVVRRLEAGQATTLAQTQTNDDGRCDRPLIEDDAFTAGQYEIVFDVGAYFADRRESLDSPAFIDEVVIRFGVAHADQHYHVPLLVSPYGYSTYRGS